MRSLPIYAKKVKPALGLLHAIEYAWTKHSEIMRAHRQCNMLSTLTIIILARTQWIYNTCHVGYASALLSKWLFAYTAIYMEKLADFYIGLYSQPGNLGQRSVTISTLFLFISVVTSIIRACMHIRACIHCDTCICSILYTCMLVPCKRNHPSCMRIPAATCSYACI